jgi:arylsulfatase A
MGKTFFLTVFFMGVFCLISEPSFCQGKSRPNIVFIMTDDLGYTDLGCYGNPYNETPHIDKLSSGGIRFTNAYAASPVCSPSRAALMTAKHPARLRLTNFLVGLRTDSASNLEPAEFQHFLPEAEVTMAERLRQHGYVSAMVGKWHLGGGKGSAPWDQGFDYSRMIGKNGLDYYNYSILSGPQQEEFVDNGQHYLTDKLTEYGLDFLDKNAGKEKPFFLFLSYSAPHVLLVPRGDKLGKYFWKYEKHGGKYNPNYGAMLESVDDGVGQIYAKLEQLNLLDNTLIIFTSDNGGVGLPELGPIPTDLSPLRKWKGHSYEGGLRIPAIMYWKGRLEAGRQEDAYFTNTDYLPTFLHLLDGKTQKLHDGVSFHPLLQGKPLDRGPIYWHYPHFSNQMGRPSGAVRQGDWKLVLSYETDKAELFNLREDIGETADLAGNHPDRTNEMKERLKKWLKEVNANMPVTKPAAKAVKL